MLLTTYILQEHVIHGISDSCEQLITPEVFMKAYKHTCKLSFLEIFWAEFEHMLVHYSLIWKWYWYVNFSSRMNIIVTIFKFLIAPSFWTNCVAQPVC
jgi:hypothetical protein